MWEWGSELVPIQGRGAGLSCSHTCQPLAQSISSCLLGGRAALGAQGPSAEEKSQVQAFKPLTAAGCKPCLWEEEMGKWVKVR